METLRDKMYTLRKSDAGDAEFAYEVVKVTMRDYAIQTWGTWLDEESKIAAMVDTESGKIQIIYIENEKAGVLQLEKRKDEIFINQIYLLPSFQSKGVGRDIVNDLKKMARDENTPLKVSVLQVNPAKEFYIKNGFEIEKETQERAYMQYVP
jgi:GNAT superfamily N-acetyltransferase